MEVKELPKILTLKANNSQRQSLQRAVSNLTSEKVSVLSRSDSVTVTSDSKQKSSSNVVREKTNSLISNLNRIAEQTEDIDKILTSLSGIAEQASAEGLPETRKSALQNEASQLADVLRGKEQEVQDRLGQVTSGKGSIVDELEQKLGRQLDLILNEKDAPRTGVATIEFSPKEGILQTLAAIKSSQRQLSSLRESIDQSRHQVQQVFGELDVARENLEASQSSIRDVEEAASVIQTLGSSIGKDPEVAIRANRLSDRSAELLRDE